MEARYLELTKIGEGVFGEVYTAKDKLTGAVHALKKIKKSETDAVLSELGALMKVKHVGIVEFMGLTQSEDGCPVIQMEYCDGGNLDAFWKEKKPDLPLKYNFMKGIAESLHHLHKNGIAHRDMKPENIMIAFDHDGNPKTKLVDFGLAKNVKGVTKNEQYMDTAVGTPFFVAPEVASGKYTMKADVFSTGIIFRAMLFDRFVKMGNTEFLGDCHYADGIHPVPWGEALRRDARLKITTDPKKMSNYRARNILDNMLAANDNERPNAEDVAEILAGLRPEHFYVENPIETSSKQPKRSQSLPVGDPSSSMAASVQALHIDEASRGDHYQQLTRSMRQMQGQLRASSAMQRSPPPVMPRTSTPFRSAPAKFGTNQRPQQRQSSAEYPAPSIPSRHSATAGESMISSDQLMQTKQLVDMWENTLTQNTSAWKRSQVQSTVGVLKKSLGKIESGISMNDEDMDLFESAWIDMDELMQQDEHDALFD